MTTYLSIDARGLDLDFRFEGLQFVGHIFSIQLGIDVDAM